jgi:hypothetical protein
MACPYFYPTARLETGAWAVPPRLPLGDAYSGECRAEQTGVQPDEATLLKFCNVGYGRGCCERFPNDATADAIRFHVANETGELIRIQYIYEKDCWPQDHGSLEYGVTSPEPRGGPGDEVLRRQADAFVESFRRRSAP